MYSEASDKKRIFLSFIFPLAFIALLWGFKIVENTTSLNFHALALIPLDFKRLPCILTSPLIHADWKHLTNNSIPLLVLGWSLFYFYKEISFKIFFLIYLLSQLWLWFLHARPGGHIGASGIVYGLGAFLIISGIIRKNKNLLAISLLVVFLYGSLIWGILPIKESISWEGHLMGMMAGIILAVYYKNSGPEEPEIHDDEDDTRENEFGFRYWETSENSDN